MYFDHVSILFLNLPQCCYSLVFLSNWNWSRENVFPSPRQVPLPRRDANPDVHAPWPSNRCREQETGGRGTRLPWRVLYPEVRLDLEMTGRRCPMENCRPIPPVSRCMTTSLHRWGNPHPSRTPSNRRDLMLTLLL